MGKGDRKTAKGKRFNSSYGNSRRHASSSIAFAGSSAAVAVKPATPVAAAPAVKKAVAKKAVAKKAAVKKSAAAE